jgi:hypothetical protein
MNGLWNYQPPCIGEDEGLRCAMKKRPYVPDRSLVAQVGIRTVTSDVEAFVQVSSMHRICDSKTLRMCGVKMDRADMHINHREAGSQTNLQRYFAGLGF